MIYRLGETKRQRRHKRVVRNLRILAPPAMALVICTTIILQNSALPGTRSIDMKKDGNTMRHTSSSASSKKAANPSKKAAGTVKSKQTVVPDTNVSLLGCDTGSGVHTGLASSSQPQLHKLAEYEQACGSAVINRVSFFVPTPTTLAQAKDYAQDAAVTLREFSKQGIAPLVFMEPTNSNGDILSLKDYRAGAYDQALDAYYAALKSQGITDAMMGMWVPLPEPNIPEWKTLDPGDFVVNVTKVVQFQKKYFPGSKASIMLDSKSYPSGASWDNGAYVSFRPYVSGFPAGLIDSFGIQGFPWVPPATDKEPASLDPKVFLPTNITIEAANLLGAKSVWLNTGSLSRSYANNKSKMVTMTPKQRQDILNGILVQAKTIKSAGFLTSVHLFAEDKSATEEGIDWSYWAKGHAADGEATGIFKTFARNAADAGVPLWLFDSDN